MLKDKDRLKKIFITGSVIWLFLILIEATKAMNARRGDATDFIEIIVYQFAIPQSIVWGILWVLKAR